MSGLGTDAVYYLVNSTFTKDVCNLYNIPLEEGHIEKFISYVCADDLMTVSAITTTSVKIGSKDIPAGTKCTNELDVIPDPTSGFPKIIIQMGGSGCVINEEPY